jgi:hypothetical protein
MLLTVLLFFAAIAIWYFELDSDRGGYIDTFKTPDKLEHAVLGGFLCSLILNVHVAPLAALEYVLYAGILFEIAQKVPTPKNKAKRKWMTLKQMWRYSWRDTVADVVGAAVVIAIVKGYLAIQSLIH